MRPTSQRCWLLWLDPLLRVPGIAARPNHANLAFEVAILGDFTQLFDDLFGAAVTARWAFTVTVVDADVNLPD